MQERRTTDESTGTTDNTTASFLTPGVKSILGAVLLFSLMQIGVKYLDRIPAHEIVFFRALVSLIVGYLLIRKLGLNPWGNNKPLLLARGLAGTAALTMFFYTLQNMPLASAVTILHLSPIFTIIIASFMVKEPPRPIQWLFFVVSFAGVIMIKGFDQRVTPIDLMIGIGAAFFAGLAYNVIRLLKDSDHALVIVFYFPLVTVPIIGAYTLFHWVTPNLIEWLILIGIGLVVTAAQILMTRAYQLEKAANVSNYNYLQIVLALFFGYVIFGELIGPLGLAGIALIVFGVIMSSRFRQEEK